MDTEHNVRGRALTEYQQQILGAAESRLIQAARQAARGGASAQIRLRIAIARYDATIERIYGPGYLSLGAALGGAR